MTTGESLVRGVTMLGTADWVRDENVRLREAGKPFLLPEGTAIVNGLSLAKNIDDALMLAERSALRKCIEIAELEGAWNTATLIRMLLQELGKGLIQESQPEPALPDNPLTVKAPV